MKKTRFILSVALIAGCTTAPARQAGISLFVGTRQGQRSVWGVDIQLDSLSFASEVSYDQLLIKEDKHGHDLRDIMTWSISENMKRLRIRFKPGLGDFGAGNTVTVHVDRSALAGYSGVNRRLEWTITTDMQ
jgi:hypothetical protein